MARARRELPFCIRIPAQVRSMCNSSSLFLAYTAHTAFLDSTDEFLTQPLFLGLQEASTSRVRTTHTTSGPVLASTSTQRRPLMTRVTICTPISQKNYPRLYLPPLNNWIRVVSA